MEPCIILKHAAGFGTIMQQRMVESCITMEKRVMEFCITLKNAEWNLTLS